MNIPAGQMARATDEAALLRRAGGRDDDLANSLLTLFAQLPAGHPERARVRDQLITMFLPLARYFARRMGHRDDSLEDLYQVAAIGLIKAVDGFDINRGVPFTVYASPTIVGEIKRYFRDKGWSMRVPRRLQELRTEIARGAGHLTQTLGAEPGVAQLAEHLGVPESDVIAGLEVATAYRTVSLQTLVGTAGGGTMELGDLLGGDDQAMAAVEARVTLEPLLARLPARERRMIALRFLENRTQSQIAEEFGISQMHVSRLLAKAMDQLRAELTEQE